MRVLTLVALLCVTGDFAFAQGTAAFGKTLTLDEAIAIALQNNPAYLQAVNSERSADAGVRSAYGSLLPTSSASFNTRYSKSGAQFFNGVALSNSSNTVSSSYSLGVNYNINASSLLAPRSARANRDAAEADIRGSAEALRAAVTQQYLFVLQAEARAQVADSLIITARGQLDLAQARVAVGAGNKLDVTRAEVAMGQAEVTSLTNHNTAQVEKLRLFQQLGVMSADTDVQLTTKFDVTPPAFSRDSVLALARQVNPAVNALRSRLRAADVDHQVSRSQYTPTLSLSTGWGGNAFQYTDAEYLVSRERQGTLSELRSCATQDSIRTRVGLTGFDCSGIVFTDEDAAAIRNSNANFPFKFTRAPFGLSASLSLPVFDGFRREQRLEQSDIARQDARYSLRARELQLNTEVTQAYLNLMTSYRVVALQEQNASRAREELAFAEERYRVGAATFLDVTTSRGTFAQAQIDRVNAVYDYHRAFAGLEAAVGRPLR
jgi:outer membrane protein